MNKERFIRLVELCENYDLDIIKKEYTKEDLSYDNYDILSYVIYDEDKKDILEYIGSLDNYKQNIDLNELLFGTYNNEYIDFIINKFNISKEVIKDNFCQNSWLIMDKICYYNNNIYIYLLKKYIL